uniref:Immunoglobulin domain-containing protein n=1 Tax=Melopsittacus undulatus TaxID=13146 RepID=A0A8C6IWS9_MELUD
MAGGRAALSLPQPIASSIRIGGSRGVRRGRARAGAAGAGGEPEQEREEEQGKERGSGLGRAAPRVGPHWPAQPLKCKPWGTGFCLMRPLQGCRGRGIVVGTVTLCLAAGWALQTPGGVSLVVPHPNINATVAQNILLSVEYTCRGAATIEWKHVSTWGTTTIVEWKSGNYVNISTAYKDRVTTFENGSIQLLNVGMRDAGYYFITVTEEHGTNTYGTIIVNVYEIIYEDLHFVAVLLHFLLLYLPFWSASCGCVINLCIYFRRR